MKHYLKSALFAVVLCALTLPVCEALTLEDVLGRVPPDSPQQAEQLYGEVLAAGDALLVALCSAIVPPETGGDAPARFALYGLTQYVVTPDRPLQRARAARLLEQAFDEADNLEVKRFFLQLLRLCGDGDTAKFLAPSLEDAALRGDAVLTLEALGDDGAAVLQAALPEAESSGRETLLAADPKRWAASVYQQAETGGRKEARRHCRELLAKDIPPQDRCVVLEALVGIAGEDALPELRTALVSPDARYRGQALRLAESMPGAQVSRAVTDTLKKADPSLRPRLIALLGGRDDAVARRAVRKALEDKDIAVRLAACDAVTRHPDKGTTRDLARALARAREDRELRAMRDALLRMPGDEVAEAAAKMVRQDDMAKRAIGLEIIGRRAAGAYLPLVRDRLQDAGPVVRRAALQALGSLAEAADMDRLLDHCVNEPQDGESNAARDALLACAADAGMGDAVIAGAVIRLPQSGEREPRLLRLLGLLGATEALQALRDHALQSAAAGRTVSAIAALEALGAADAGKAHSFLLEAYQSLEQPDVRLTAAKQYAGILGRIRDAAAQRTALTLAAGSARTEEERAVFSAALAALDKKN